MRSCALVIVLAIAPGVFAQETIDEEVVARIKMEGFQRSQVIETLAMLTDVDGPRLTGSPGLSAASEWSRDKLSEWGLESAQLES
jgi:carboxypeptidase Q